jgi:hypothetical protein
MNDVWIAIREACKAHRASVIWGMVPAIAKLPDQERKSLMRFIRQWWGPNDRFGMGIHFRWLSRTVTEARRQYLDSVRAEEMLALEPVTGNSRMRSKRSRLASYFGRLGGMWRGPKGLATAAPETKTRVLEASKMVRKTKSRMAGAEQLRTPQTPVDAAAQSEGQVVEAPEAQAIQPASAPDAIVIGRTAVDGRPVQEPPEISRPSSTDPGAVVADASREAATGAEPQDRLQAAAPEPDLSEAPTPQGKPEVGIVWVATERALHVHLFEPVSDGRRLPLCGVCGASEADGLHIRDSTRRW